MKKKLVVSLILLILMLACAVPAMAEDINLLMNPQFEDSTDNLPAYWETDAWYNDSETTSFSLDAGRTGNAICIENFSSNDARFVQEVDVEPNTVYKLSGYIKTEGVTEGWGANLSFQDTFVVSEKIYGTSDGWKYIEIYGWTDDEQEQIHVMARLGGYAGESYGKAWFDDLRLDKIDNIPEGVMPQSIKTSKPSSSDTASNNKMDFQTPMMLISAAFLVMFFVFWKRMTPSAVTSLEEDKNRRYNFLLFGALILIGFVIRLVLAYLIYGYPNDIACWIAWSDSAATGGLANFYNSGMFSDYPPGYIYVLSFLGKIVRLFGVTNSSSLHVAILKLPSICVELLSAWIIFRASYRRFGGTAALILGSFFLFNPAVILNSSAWGQVDSILALFMLAFLFLLYEDKLWQAAAVFALGLLFKPQMLFAAPALIPILICHYREHGLAKTLKRLTGGIIVAAGVFILLVIPFSLHQTSPFWLVGQYASTLSSYPYATINACNLFMLVHANWIPLTDSFLGLNYGIWGTIGMIAAFGYYVLVSVKDKNKSSIFFNSAVLIIGFFTLGAKMHERYMYPALLLLLVAYIITRRKQILGCFALFSFTQFANGALTLANKHMDMANAWTTIISAVVVLGYAYSVYLAWIFATEREDKLTALLFTSKNKKQPLLPGTEQEIPMRGPLERLKRSPKLRSMLPTRKDWLIVAVLTLAYSFIAFTQLGDLHVPTTYWNANKSKDQIVLDFGQEHHVGSMWFYQYVLQSSGVISVESLQGDDPATGIWQEATSIEFTSEDFKDKGGDVFKWQTKKTDFSTRYLRIVSQRPGLRLSEVAFKDENGQVIPIVSLSDIICTTTKGTPDLLFDEQNLVPAMSTYMNGTYFDEIYHARTAWENLNKIWPFEISHPPLGKIIIALGVKIFGMVPFGWRVMGTLFGVLMLPMMYLLAKAVFRRTRYAFIATFLLTFDFMHFTQTRIATIDSYGVFFIIGMFFFMALYYRMNYNTMSLKKILPVLALCGLFFGLGAASKWIDIYAGIGLFVLYVYLLIQRIQEYRFVCSNEPAPDDEELYGMVRRQFRRKTTIILLCSVLFFIVIPAAIYIASYIPYQIADTNHRSLLRIVMENQKFMFHYHSTLYEATPHPYASPWYQWPFIYKPICFYVNFELPEGRMTSIASFGNPAVWWAGTAAMVWLVLKTIRNGARNKTGLFILIGFAAQFLPWVLVPRSMFIYHYFASVPFFIMAIVQFIRDKERMKPKLKKYVWIYLAIVALLFAFFYPLLSGMEVSHLWGLMMRWLPSWNIVY